MRFSIIGGDVRQANLSALIQKDGHEVRVFGIDAPPESCAGILCDSLAEVTADTDCVVLPIPVNRDCGMINAPALLRPLPISEFAEDLRSGQLVVGGRCPDDLIQLCQEKDIYLVDVLEREDFAVANAVPTAEGALQLALSNTNFTLHSTPILVIGYGRIGKILAQYLQALGAQVTVSARKAEAFAWLAVQNIRAVHSHRLDGAVSEFPLVFNTVPELMLPENLLRQLPTGALIIDLASSPGGVDFDAARRLGLRCLWSLGLPGKTAPQTAGAILRNTVYSIMKESGYMG